MSGINNPSLARQIRERLRPRAEQFYGLITLIADDLPTLSSLSPAIGDTDIVDDGADAPLSYTGIHWRSYIGLCQALIGGSANSTLMAAMRAAVVRPLSVIVSGLNHITPSTSRDPVVVALADRIRPRCRLIRALRYLAMNDLRIFQQLLSPEWSDTDTIEEYREDNVPPLTVGQIRIILAFASAATGSEINSEAVAVAVDAACVDPLEVR